MNKLDPNVIEAYKVFDSIPVNKELASKLGMLSGSSILDLASLANKVKNSFSSETHVCTIFNAKSGNCKENCRFCAQSAHNNAAIEEYDLLDKDKVLEGAYKALDSGVKRFGIVTSGTGFNREDEDFKRILEIIEVINHKIPEMSLCASLGILDEEAVKALAERKIKHYNINLQTSSYKFKELVSTTMDFDGRIDTIKNLKKYGIKVCSGGIIGLGETMQDRIDMAFQLKELDVDVIPLNVLIPIPGTPLENQESVSVADIVKTFSIFRLINPEIIIKFAAGRETKMKDFQGLIMLSGANGYLTGGYLTTRGRSIEDDKMFFGQLDSFYTD